MLIAKTTPSFKKQLIEALTQDMTPEELEAIAARMRKAREEKAVNKERQEGLAHSSLTRTADGFPC